MRLEGRLRAEDLEIKAAAAAAGGQFTQAVEIATQAIELADDAGEQWRIKRLERQLRSYRRGKPFIEQVRKPRF
jgi:uncharacterized protein YfdQ (DUF2303 family)